MAVWSVPKHGTELLENLEPVLDSPRTVWVVCVIIYAINMVWVLLGQKWPWISVPLCLVRGLPTDSPLLV